MAKGLLKVELQLANDEMYRVQGRFHTVLVELAMGTAPEHTEVSPDFGPDGGGQTTLTLWHSDSASGGLVMTVTNQGETRPYVYVSGVDRLAEITREYCKHTDSTHRTYAHECWQLEAMSRIVQVSHAITRGDLKPCDVPTFLAEHY